MNPSASIAEPIRRVGVIGPGLMGLGVAQALAVAGLDVALCGRDEAAAGAGRERLAAALHRQVARGRIGAEAAALALARVRVAPLFGLADRQLVIESVPENRALKTAVLAAAESAAPDAILASNTSGLAIGGLAQGLRRPQSFLGLHFFSPVERMPLVEVVTGAQTSPAVAEAALAFVRAVGKRPVLVRDGPGFFATRVFAAYLDEAVAMLSEGVAAEAIEAAAVAAGRALGPLATLDETGLALNLAQARQARLDGLPDRFCRPLAAPTLELLVAAGRRGRRDGGGFYDGPGEGGRSLWPELRRAFPPAALQPSAEAIGVRLFAAEAREALRCLEEGVIADADDGDAASVLGLGFPQARGGILRAAEDFGLVAFAALCERLATAHGERFAPSPWLRALGGLQDYRKGTS